MNTTDTDEIRAALAEFKRSSEPGDHSESEEPEESTPDEPEEAPPVTVRSRRANAREYRLALAAGATKGKTFA